MNYDLEDVIDVIKNLTLKDYSETLFDNDNDRPPLLFVFGKDINNKTVYIKLKVRDNIKNYILCVSFHYAEFKMSHPYA